MLKKTILKSNKEYYKIEIKIDKKMGAASISVDKDFLEVFKSFPGIKFNTKNDFMEVLIKIKGTKK